MHPTRDPIHFFNKKTIIQIFPRNRSLFSNLRVLPIFPSHDTHMFLPTSRISTNICVIPSFHPTPSARSPTSPSLQITRLALFAFDEKRGNALLASSSKVYKRLSVVSHTDSELAEICLPDGAHARHSDACALIFKTADEKTSVLYGYSCFRNVIEEREKRGARQASILCVSNSPVMECFRPVLVDALNEMMKDSRWGEGAWMGRVLNATRAMLESAFNSNAGLKKRIAVEVNEDAIVRSVQMFGRRYEIHTPHLVAGELGGANLKDLLKVFREKTMRIWIAIALEKRVVISCPGMSAAATTSLVLATPLLLGELAPFVALNLEPYITLAVVDRITAKRTFVAGCNNATFLQKTEWWDLYGNASSGFVSKNIHSAGFSSPPSAAGGTVKSLIPAKLKKAMKSNSSSSLLSSNQTDHHYHPGGVEMAFISRVLAEMDFQSEAWLRRQFYDFTLSFLNRVSRRENHPDLSLALAGMFPGASIMQRKIVKFAEQFANGKLWKKYRARQDAMWGGGSLEAGGPGLASLVVDEFLPNRIASGRISEDDAEWEFVQNPRSASSSLAPFHVEYLHGAKRAPLGFVRVVDCLSAGVGKAKPILAEEKKCDENTESNTSWVRIVPKDGSDVYFWNVSTGETVWDMPAT